LIWKIIYHCFSRLALMDLSSNNGTKEWKSGQDSYLVSLS
jgi:hypothetical protein